MLHLTVTEMDLSVIYLDNLNTAISKHFVRLSCSARPITSFIETFRTTSKELRNFGQIVYLTHCLAQRIAVPNQGEYYIGLEFNSH